MSNGPWTDEENDLIVADYFAMLADDISARRYSKAEHRRALLPLLNDRSEGSVEFKHQNISAVLKGLGEDWIPGYKPAFNFQMTLVDAVARWLALNPAWLGRQPGLQPAAGLREAAQIWIGPPPTLSNQPPPQELEQMLHIARKFDVAGRDERNRALGRAGEERVLAHERAALRTAGRDDLARKVRWVSEEDGDGAGYDIASFAPDGLPRLIEVKTTNGWERTPFHITRNELAVAEERRSEWRPVPPVEFLTRAEGVRTAPAAGRACLADRDDVSGELLQFVLAPQIVGDVPAMHLNWPCLSLA
jgi:hypothetical protein